MIIPIGWIFRILAKLFRNPDPQPTYEDHLNAFHAAARHPDGTYVTPFEDLSEQERVMRTAVEAALRAAEAE
jgi:hypothetical protein